ncbi:TELO2-interacting protein 1-like protein, partial [Dinothrombium tinctorium]
MIKSLSAENCANVLSAEFRPILGHSISVLLNFAVYEKYKDLRKLALITFHTLIQKSISNSAWNGTSINPGDIFASFLPGISVNLTKILTNDDKVNRELIISSLRLFRVILTCTLCDTSGDIQSKHCSNEQFIVFRDDEWFEKCSTKLVPAIRKIIFTLISHQAHEVRKELLIFCKEILLNCSTKFLRSSVDAFLEVPLSMLNEDDDYDGNCKDLSALATEFISHFSAAVLNSSRTLTDVIFDQIYKFVSSFPREMRSLDENHIAAKINILNGYITCLGTSGISLIMSMDLYRQRLFQCLIDLAEFDYKSIDRLYNFVKPISDTGGDSADEDNLKPLFDVKRKKFKHFNETRTERCLQRCCFVLGSLCDKNVLLDFLLDISRAGNASALYTLNCILRGIKEKTTNIVQILEEYLARLRFPQPSSQLSKIKAQIDKEMLTCQLLEGIGVLASLCCVDYRHKFINETLFVLIAYSGFENYMVSQTAKNTMQDLADTFDYTCINHLIAENVNYITNCVNIKLRHFENIDEVNVVITKILNITNLNCLPYLERTLDEAIATLDVNYQSGNKCLFKILHTFVKVVYNLQRTACEQSNDVSHESTFKMQCYLRNKKIAECLQIDESVETNEEKESSEEQEERVEQEAEASERAKSKLPIYASMILKILERCKHIISHPDVKIRLMTLDSIAYGMRVIRNFEEHLLPMAHQLWHPLVARFKDNDVMIIMSAFTCLLAMAETCKDFVRSRTLKEVLPSLIYFLKCEAKRSYRKDTPAYRFTLNYKLQLQLLSGLGKLANDLLITERDLWTLVDATLPYFSAKQPRELQKAALNAFKFYIQIDPCVCWYFLMQLYNDRADCDDYSGLAAVNFEGWQSDDCKRNVNVVLKEEYT